jgi:hypothetical protein
MMNNPLSGCASRFLDSPRPGYGLCSFFLSTFTLVCRISTAGRFHHPRDGRFHHPRDGRFHHPGELLGVLLLDLFLPACPSHMHLLHERVSSTGSSAHSTSSSSHSSQRNALDGTITVVKRSRGRLQRQEQEEQLVFQQQAGLHRRQRVSRGEEPFFRPCEGHCKQPLKERGGDGYRNCGDEGHMSNECTEPRNMDNVECKNCSKMGHFGHDCHDCEPDVCRNCGEEGHRSKECESWSVRPPLDLRPVRSLPTTSSCTSDVQRRPLRSLPMCCDLFVHFIASALAGVPVRYSARPTNGLGVTPIGHPSFLSRIQKSPSEGSHWSFRLSTSLHLELAGMQLLAQWMITSAAGQGSSHRRRSARGRRSDLCCLSGKAHPDNRLLIDWR